MLNLFQSLSLVVWLSKIFSFISGDELLSDSFPYKEIQNGILWEVEGKVSIFSSFTLNFLKPNVTAFYASEASDMTVWIILLCCYIILKQKGNYALGLIWRFQDRLLFVDCSLLYFWTYLIIMSYSVIYVRREWDSIY